MKRLLLLSAMLALAPPGEAAFNSSNAGTSGADFLQLGSDARSAAMGQAVRANAEDATAVYWNPAGLASLEYRHATLTHAAYYQSAFYDFMAYAQPLQSVLGASRERELRPNQLGAVGVAVIYLNAGQISEIDNTGSPTGSSFTPQDIAVMAGWGAALTRNLDVGVGAKYISSKIEETAATGAFDFGARLRLRPFDIPYVVSAGARNVGGHLKFISQSDPTPLEFSVGQSVRPFRNWAIDYDVVAPRDGPIYHAVGSEYRVIIDAQLTAVLRVGYQSRNSSRDLQGSLTGLSAGGGLGFSRFGVDYAWAPFGLLGDTHRFSVSYRF